MHHSHVISIKGDSYRLKEKMDFLLILFLILNPFF
ncbi:hypothetical protein [Marinitoga sp. 1154]